MPDWTYHPLRPAANALVGERRAQRWALRLLGTLSAMPSGAATIRRVFDHPEPPADWANRFGAAVPVSAARDAIRALPPQGAGFVEVGPVDATTVATLREAARGRRCRVIARVTDEDVAADLADAVDEVLVGETSSDRKYLTDPDITEAVRALADPGTTVVATPALLVAAGPGWFQRVIEAAAPPVPPAPTLREVPLDPRRWPGWFWSLLVGIGMVVAGLGAAAITLGPVLLWYDRDYLGTDVDGLHRINHHLVHFLQHDRITMAGNMVAIGSMYIGLAWGGIRRGWAWARTALLLSGLVGFPTLFYFLFIGFVEPLHVAVTMVLFPMFLLGVRRTPGPPSRRSSPPCPEPVRRRALIGQLLTVGTGVGVVIGGIVISTVGLTVVFVPTDLDFLHTDADTLRAANANLLPFTAHDRAGFGGALIATGVGIVLIGMWGWRQGEAWVWWSLLGAAAAGSVSALAVHFLIHYTAFIHLLPVYVGTALLVVALALSRAFLVEPRPADIEFPQR
ncbi:hypothetical protein [Nocardia sp. NPDC003345]